MQQESNFGSEMNSPKQKQEKLLGSRGISGSPVTNNDNNKLGQENEAVQEKEGGTKSEKKPTRVDLLMKKVKERLGRWGQAFADSGFITSTYSFIIIVSIFGDDVRRAFIPKSGDLYIDVPLMVIMAIFILEILYNIITRKGAYALSFAIILDLFATFSILFDITLFYETVLAPYDK